MSRVIVVTSGKGGVGKTTITANLGRELARLGARVVMMDTDIGLNNLDVLMDVESKVVFDIIDVVQNRCRLRQALIADDQVPGCWVLPSAHSAQDCCLNGQNIKAITRQLAATCDYVLLDCPAGIELGFHRALAAADEALIVVTPHISSIRDADKVSSLVGSYDMRSVHLVVNRARGDLILSSEMVGISDIESILRLPVIGTIPEDDAVNLVSNLGLVSNRGGAGRQAMRVLASNVHFGTSTQFDITRQYRGIVGAFRRRLRRSL